MSDPVDDGREREPAPVRFQVHVDEHRCIGAGQCVWVAPQVFDQRDSDGIVVLLNPQPPAELHPYVQEAARVCPARAIRVDARDGDG